MVAALVGEDIIELEQSFFLTTSDRVLSNARRRNTLAYCIHPQTDSLDYIHIYRQGKTKKTDSTRLNTAFISTEPFWISAVDCVPR